MLTPAGMQTYSGYSDDLTKSYYGQYDTAGDTPWPAAWDRIHPCKKKTTHCAAGEKLSLNTKSDKNNDCEPCAEGYYMELEGANRGATACLRKKTSCPYKHALIGEEPGEHARDVDDTVCHPKARCSAGQHSHNLHGETLHRAQYNAKGRTFDECRPCELHTYRDLDEQAWAAKWLEGGGTGAAIDNTIDYHYYAACKPCPVGTYTEATGATGKGLCKRPNVVTLRSTNRLFYWYNGAMKVESECLSTSIRPLDSSRTMGNAALRVDALSPMCADAQIDPDTYVIDMHSVLQPHPRRPFFSCCARRFFIVARSSVRRCCCPPAQVHGQVQSRVQEGHVLVEWISLGHQPRRAFGGRHFARTSRNGSFCAAVAGGRPVCATSNTQMLAQPRQCAGHARPALSPLGWEWEHGGARGGTCTPASCLQLCHY